MNEVENAMGEAIDIEDKGVVISETVEGDTITALMIEVVVSLSKRPRHEEVNPGNGVDGDGRPDCVDSNGVAIGSIRLPSSPDEAISCTIMVSVLSYVGLRYVGEENFCKIKDRYHCDYEFIDGTYMYCSKKKKV